MKQNTSRVPIRIRPGEEEGEHRIPENGEELGGRIVVRPPHEGDEVQHAKEPLPSGPFEPVERGERKAGGEWSSVHGRSERDEDRQLLAERGAHAEREGDECQTVALRMTDKCDLRSARNPQAV